MTEKNTLSKAVGNTFLYSLSGLLLRASSIFLFPVFTIYLSKSDYGILSITQSLTTILSILASVELSRAITRFIYHDEFKKFGPEKISSQVLWYTVISNTVLCLLFLFTGKWILAPFIGDIPFYPYMFYTLLSMPLVSVFEFSRNYLKSIGSGKKAFLVEMFYYGGNIVFNIILVVVFKLGVMGIIYSTLIAGAFFLIYFIISESAQFLHRISLNIIKPLFRYAFPVFIFVILGFILESTDRLILNKYMGSGISGVYYVAITYATLFSAIKEAFNYAFVPWYFGNKDKISEREVRTIFSFIFWGAGIICALMSFFSYEVLYLLSSNPDLIKASDFVPFTVFSLYIVFIGQFYNIPMLYKIKESRYIVFSNLGGVVASVLLCFLLIPGYKEFGALTARMIAFLFMTIIQLYLCRRFTDTKINIPFISGIFVLFFALSNINFLPISYIYLLIIKILIGVLMMSVYLYYLNKRINLLRMLNLLLKRDKK